MIEIEKILKEIERVTGVKPTPFNTSKINKIPAINYTIYRDSNDGIKSSYRFEIRIVANSLSASFGLENKIQNALVTVGDETKFDCVIEQNGGGSLEDETTGLPQIILIYDITKRSL